MLRPGDETVKRLRDQSIALRKLVKERVRPWEIDLAAELLQVAIELDLQAERLEHRLAAAP